MKPAKRVTVQPNRFLGDKVPKTGGPSPEQAIAKALKLGEELIESYQGWAVDDLHALWQECKSITPDDPEVKQRLNRLYDMSHEIRGQGGTFGFPLISLLGDSLCKYLETQNTLGDRSLGIIRIHIHAMKAVFRQNLRGEQTSLVRQMAELLAALRAQ